MIQNNKNQNIKDMKKILDIIYGNNTKQETKPKLTIKLRSTIHPDEKLTRQEWIDRYQVSILYDKKIIHIGQLVDLCVRAPQVKLGSFFNY